MNKYFKLNPFVIFKQGDNEGCLYNLSNGNMFNVKENMYDILKKVENNISIDELNNEEVCFLDKLESMGLGKYWGSVLKMRISHVKSIFPADTNGLQTF